MTTHTEAVVARDAALTFAERDVASREALTKLSDFRRGEHPDIRIAELLGALAWDVPHLLAYLMDEHPTPNQGDGNEAAHTEGDGHSDPSPAPGAEGQRFASDGVDGQDVDGVPAEPDPAREGDSPGAGAATASLPETSAS